MNEPALKHVTESAAPQGEVGKGSRKGVLHRLLGFWEHPLAREIQLESAAAIGVHRRIIESKPLLLSVYRDWYRRFLPAAKATTRLAYPMIEIGSGASHLEKYIPDVIKTDVVAHPNVQGVVNAEALPYPDEGLRAIFLLDAFHHIPEPARFLAEAQRSLAKGGRLVITEPSNSILTRFFIKYLHPQEHWDETAKDWRNQTTGRLSDANVAMPWIVFERDRARFEREFPHLKILSIRRHTMLAYYLSGGLSYRSFFPPLLLPLLHLAGFLARPLHPSLGMMMTVEIEKI